VETVDLIALADQLQHPFPRYGMAVTIVSRSLSIKRPIVSSAEFREALACTIEDGLNTFRMATPDNPTIAPTLTFRGISLEKLEGDAGLVSGPLASQGIYLFPSVIATDKQVKGTFGEAIAIRALLRNSKIRLDSSVEMKRSFAPITGEINNGKNEKKNQYCTLFEAACCTISTLTPIKPSALASARGNDQQNSAIFPDLPIDSLVEFVRVFRRLQSEGGSLLIGRPTKEKKVKRPPIHDGNYPDAPRESAFGAVGLLAAMGYWAQRCDETTREATIAVLDYIKDVSLYTISYGDSSQSRFSHAIIDLASRGQLRPIVQDLYQSCLIYSGFEHGTVVHYAPPRSRDVAAKDLESLFRSYRHFYMLAGRFFQQFDVASFKGFLSVRAEYPPSFKRILEVYFMKSEESISLPIVDAARILGQWINKTSFFVAMDEVDKKDKDRSRLIRRAKAKVLVEFESAIMSATSPEEMLARISVRAGRLLQGDVPGEAEPFFTATATGSITYTQAQHLIIAFLRLRTIDVPDLKISDDDPSIEDDDSELAEGESK